MSRRRRVPTGAAPSPCLRPLRSRRPASPPISCGPFRHPAQSVVSLDPLGAEHRPLDTLAVVSHPQAEFLVVVADLRPRPARPPRAGTRSEAPPPRPCRSRRERSAAGPARAPRLLTTPQAVRARAAASSSLTVLIADRLDRSARTSEGRKSCTAFRPSVIARRRLLNRALQCLLSLLPGARAAVQAGLEAQEQPMEALEERVVQLRRRFASAPRSSPRASLSNSCRTWPHPGWYAPASSTSTSPTVDARNQVVFHQGGVITIRSDTPCSFHRPSLFESLHAEHVCAGVEVRVGREAVSAVRLVPAGIEALEPVTITVLVRVGVTQRRELEGEHVVLVTQGQGLDVRDGLLED